MSSHLSSFLSRIATESGFTTAIHSSRDTKLLCLQRFVRLFAYGASFLILVHFLSTLGFSDERIGLFMTLTLLGDVVISFVLTMITDQVGRRRVLAAGASMMIMSGLVFSLSGIYWLLLIASVFGVISPSGNEIGPFRAVEESILAQLTEKDKRSDIFAWYTLSGTAGAALGTLTCGWMLQALQDKRDWSEIASYRAVFVLYATTGVIKLVLTILLSTGVELEQQDTQYHQVDVEMEAEGLLSDSSDGEDEARSAPKKPNGSPTSEILQDNVPPKPTVYHRVRSLFPQISPVSRSILVRLILLFAIDSFASGLASPSWLTYFFTTVHHLQPSSLGTLFLITNLLATVSNLLALPLARRLGPLKTMSFTHLPSAIFLGLIPLPQPSSTGTWFAMCFLSLRACTQSMDQAPRQAFLSAAVLPAERTAVLGVVNIAKTLAQAGGIGSAGALAGRNLWIPNFSGAGVMKACYDLLMLCMFLGLKEREGGG